MPELRRRRRRSHRPRIERSLLVRFAAVAALAVAGIVALAAVVLRPHPADPAAARQELIAALGLLHAGNASAARNHAIAASQADPASGAAQAVLARAYLALGDGIAAEGALGRARAAGFDPRNAQHLYAHAYLLQGDATRALDAARRASPRYATYATRIGARALAQQGDVAGGERALAILLAADVRNGAAWGDLARIRYDAGDVGGAIDAAARALAANRNDVAALTLRGELVRAQYGLVAALPWFEQALRHDAYYHPALIEYAATLGDAGRYADSLAATRKALAARPGSPQALYLQAVLAARAGANDLAAALMARTGGSLDDLPGALLLNGTLAYRQGAYEQAIERWRELVGRQPTNITARRLLGAALLRSGDARGALDTLRPVALRADADPYTLTLVARAFERTGERDWAARFLDRAAGAGPAGSTPFGGEDSVAVAAATLDDDDADPARRIGYVRALLDAGDSGTALAQARALTTDQPGAPAAYLALGDVLASSGKPADAATAYARAADLRFDEATMLRLVDTLARAGRPADAARALALYLAQHPESVAARRLAAQAQLHGGAWQAAIATLEHLRARLGNRDAALLSDLAAAYTGAGDPALASRYARAAYRLAPMRGGTIDAYGWALYQQGETARALPLLQKAAAIAPGATVRWHLAQAYADGHRLADARAALQGLLADPAFTDRAPAQALLKALG